MAVAVAVVVHVLLWVCVGGEKTMPTNCLEWVVSKWIRSYLMIRRQRERENNSVERMLKSFALGLLSGQMNVTPFDSRFQYITLALTHLSSYEKKKYGNNNGQQSTRMKRLNLPAQKQQNKITQSRMIALTWLNSRYFMFVSWRTLLYFVLFTLFFFVVFFFLNSNAHTHRDTETLWNSRKAVRLRNGNNLTADGPNTQWKCI